MARSRTNLNGRPPPSGPSQGSTESVLLLYPFEEISGRDFSEDEVIEPCLPLVLAGDSHLFDQQVDGGGNRV